MLCRRGLSKALRAQLRTAQDIHGGGGGADFSRTFPWGRTLDEEIDTNLRRMTTKTAHDALIMAPHARPPILGMCAEESAEQVTKGPHSHGLCSLLHQTLKAPVAQKVTFSRCPMSEAACPEPFSHKAGMDRATFRRSLYLRSTALELFQ